MGFWAWRGIIIMPETDEGNETTNTQHITATQHTRQHNILGRRRSGIIGIGEHTGIVGVSKAKQSFRVRVYTQSLSEGASLDFFCVESIWARGKNTRRREIVKVLQGGSRPGTETYQSEPTRAAMSAQLTIQSYIVSYVILFVDLMIFVVVL